MIQKKKKGLSKDVVNERDEDFDDGMKQMWVGMKGYWVNKQERQDTGIAT